MKLIVDLDDGTDRDELARILGVLAAHRPYVTGAVLTTDYDDGNGESGGGLGTEWW